MKADERQKLFNYMSNEHGLHLLENELDEIEHILGDKREYAETKCKEQDRNTRHKAAETVLLKAVQVKSHVFDNIAQQLHQEIMNLKSETPNFE